MNITEKSPVRRAFPLVDVGQGFHEIQNANGKAIFHLHVVDPGDSISEGLSGVFISEGMGAADALLPGDYPGRTFTGLEEAYAYCIHSLETLTASLNVEKAA